MINLLIATITVLTWNTGRMGQFEKPEKNEVLHYLLTQDADVVCLQEVDVYKSEEFLTLPDVKRTLRNKYPYSYIDFAIYNKRHQYGTMVWAKYPLINKQSIHYESRGNLSNRCDMVVGADTIRLINNHLESYSFTPADIETDSLTHYSGLLSAIKRIKAKWERAFKLRNAQARVVRKEIETSPYPVIAVGDFNATALSYAYWHISNGMHDAWRETHSWQWGATCEKAGFGIRIDYILCSDPIKPVACSVPDAPGSDHRPVVATLAW
jgi:endonuclease/exonuclease/phosphatase family metal-dependent hydrolase